MALDRRNRRTAIQSGFVLLGGIAALAGLALWLERELSPRRSGDTERELVATLGTGVNTVQRKFDREMLWEGVVTRSDLYRRDAIRTGEDSQAKILFDDGTLLELSENSMVILDRSEDRIAVEFLSGSVFAKGVGGSAVEIQSGGAKVSVGGGGEAGALALRSGESGIQVTVEEGTARLQSGEGSLSLGANELGRLGEGGLGKESLAIRSILPAQGARIVAPAAVLPVEFTWERLTAKAAALPETLQVARDADFKDLVFDVPARTGHRLDLREGHYHWRVVAREGTKIAERSAGRELRVVRHAAVRLDRPEAGGTVGFFRREPAVTLAWTTLGEGGGADQVQLSADASFAKLIEPSSSVARAPSTEAGGSRGEAVFPALPEGDYYWRVVTRYDGSGADAKGVQRIATKPRTFSVRRLGRLPAPRPLEPAPGASVGVTDQSQETRIRWEPVPEAAGYRVRLASDGAMRNVLLEKWVESPELRAVVPASGRVHWSVQAASAREPADEDSVPSEPANFILARGGGFRLLQPQAGAEIPYLEEIPEIPFSWEPVGGASEYVVEIARDRGFSEILLSLESTAASLRVDEAPQGERFWRVRAIDSEDRPIAMSTLGSYVLKQAPAPVPPEKLAPEPMAAIRAIPRPTVEFRWKPVPGAVAYSVRAWRLDASGRPVPDWSEKAAGETLSRPLGPGSYRWDVRSIDVLGRVGEAGQPRAFEIRNTGLLPPPGILAPAMGEKVSDTDPRAISLEWAAVDGAVEYALKLERVEPSGARTLVRTLRTRDTEYEAPASLSSGEYAWEVSAVGVAEDAESKAPVPGEPAGSRFSVRWVGLLAAPSGFRVRMESDASEPAGPASRSPAARRSGAGGPR